MAYTEKRDTRTGGASYVGRFRVDGRLRSTRAFRSRRDALAEARRAEEAGKLGAWVDPRGSAITLAGWFADWQTSRADRAPRTLEAERERFRSLVAPTFGETPLRRITHDDVSRWAAGMRAPRTGEVASRARRRDAVRLLVALLDAAVDSRRLTTNPARTPSGRVPGLPRAPRTKAHRYLSHEQLRRVADAARTHQGRTLVLLAGLTGLRWGEISALRTGDVDLLRGRIVIERAYTRLDDGTLLLGDTKTHARREVPVPGVLAADLSVLLAARGTGLLFAGRDGGPLRRESFDRNAYRPAVRAAGGAVTTLQELLGVRGTRVVDAETLAAVRRVQTQGGLPVTGVVDAATWEVLVAEDRRHRGELSRAAKVARSHRLGVAARLTLGAGAEDFEPLTLHDLRHTAASLAIAGGASVKAVQRMLGHESPVLTLRTYAGLFEDDLDRLGEAMSAQFAAQSLTSAAHHTLTESPVSVPDVRALPSISAR
ncbi:putative peptidoglycan binding protein [Isoptericola sp. CG 20/1183]|uniref:Peptidoglycan binding protein n=1 Tax=Isoptericola halotolerans TaxID=300560 RepID=A0ABX5EDT5_9MICO|nr:MULTISPECIES: tyrosine-type recombinase/integrase [Isoptericola]PRZ04482.1 putative peptidoglycan binding protein [Isoptericola halotolerans]PRZ04620.1 putative peptidoglycan binding protein [Isoptericola sp. CG 20/1183]